MVGNKVDHKLRMIDAYEEAKNGTCLRRNYGAVLVVDGEVFTGNSHFAKGLKPCKTCYRETCGIPSGTRYEECQSIHAEWDALMKATNLVGHKKAVLYLGGYEADGSSIFDARPCAICHRMLMEHNVKIMAMGKDGKVYEWDGKE